MATNPGLNVNPTLVKFPFVAELPGGVAVNWEEVGVAVDGPKEVSDLTMDKGPDGKIYIQFTTDLTGQYTVTLTHNNKLLNRSPVTINVHKSTDPAPKQAPAPAADPAAPKTRTIRFKVPNTKGWELQNLLAYIHEGPETNPNIKLERDGAEIAVCLDLSKPGKYMVGIRQRNGVGELDNSPFTINVPDNAFKF